jgi:hypothetical protein
LNQKQNKAIKKSNRKLAGAKLKISCSRRKRLDAFIQRLFSCLALCTTLSLSRLLLVAIPLRRCGRPYPDRNILLLFSLLVGGRVASNGWVLARLDLGVGREDLLWLVCRKRVSQSCFQCLIGKRTYHDERRGCIPHQYTCQPCPTQHPCE